MPTVYTFKTNFKIFLNSILRFLMLSLVLYFAFLCLYKVKTWLRSKQKNTELSITA